MDVQAEKSEILRKVELVSDEELIRAIQSLLNFGLSHQPIVDFELEESINRGLEQLERGEGRPHEEVWASLKGK